MAHRAPFVPADADALIAFCVESGSAFDPAILRRLLLDLTSDPAGVLIVADGSGPLLAATVVDRGENGADAASLEVLGVGATVPGATFAELVVAPAIAFARAGVRRALHVPVLLPSYARIEGAERALADAGFAPHHDLFTMRRSATAPAPAPAPPLPSGWRWASLDGAWAAAAHAALSEAFRGSPSFILSPLPEFRRAVASGATVWRALVDGDAIAGLVQVAARDAGHELRTVARRPAYRGRGLGARLVTEGLRTLGARGARNVELSVEARNDQALSLYRRFGFEVVGRTPVYALGLR